MSTRELSRDENAYFVKSLGMAFMDLGGLLGGYRIHRTIMI